MIVLCVLGLGQWALTVSECEADTTQRCRSQTWCVLRKAARTTSEAVAPTVASSIRVLERRG